MTTWILLRLVGLWGCHGYCSGWWGSGVAMDTALVGGVAMDTAQVGGVVGLPWIRL